MNQLALDLPPAAKTQGVLVALSGGVDSTVLLYLAKIWAAEHGAKLVAAHIDHQLRPDSQQDASFCRRLCLKLKVELKVQPLTIQGRGSLQENARVQRYAALARIAAEAGLSFILTAHHIDDALETALLNFRRGSSSAGLSALLRRRAEPIPDWPQELKLWRPLINASSAQIIEFARQNQIAWHEDPSNQKRGSERNRLRHEVMDELTQSGRHRAGMLDTLKNLAGEREALDIWAENALTGAALKRPDYESVAFKVAPLRAMPFALITRVLQLAAGSLPAEVSLKREQLNQAAHLIQTKRSGRIDARGGLLHITQSCALFEVARGRGARRLADRRAAQVQAPPADDSSDAPLLPWFGTQFAFRAAPHLDPPDKASSLQATISAPAIIRGAAPGDRVRLAGLNGHKSLAALFSEANIPDFLRWRWPVFARADEPDEILWVCGLRHAKIESNRQPQPTPFRAEWSVSNGSIFAHALNA